MKQLLLYAFKVIIILNVLYLAHYPTYSQELQKKNLEFSPVPDPLAQYEWIDADGDKDLDALIFNQSNWENKKESVRLYENRNGKFTEVSNFFGASVEIIPISYAFGDYDQDGDIDFLIQDSKQIRVARNDNRLSFTLQNLPGISTISSKPILQWLDIDNDADLDIISSSPTSFAPVVYFNQQNTFVLSPHPLSASLQSLSFADVNNDGLPDFVGAKGHTNSNPLFLHINKGDGLFELIDQELVPEFADGGKLLWSDLDGDLDLDVFVVTASNQCRILRNLFKESGQPNFETAYQINDFYFPKIDIGDINQDGLPDLICSGEMAWQPKTFVYLNHSNKTSLQFEGKDLNIPIAARNLDVVDINRDQALDVVLISRNTYNEEVYFEWHQNSSVKPGFKLPAPTKLQSEVKESALLRWAPIKAASTVYYNVEIKRNNKLYKSALALSDGSSLWPQNPYKHLLTKLNLKNLPAGTYQWRVQAIDAAGHSSTFSKYQSFTITPGPTNLVLKQLALTRMRLQWTYKDSSNHNLVIFRRSANMPLEQIASLPASVNSFEDSTIFTNRTYEYVVKAELAGIFSAASNQVQVNTKQFVKKNFPDPRPRAVPGLGHSADVDNDGDYDFGMIARKSHIGPSTSLLKNNGNGTFTASELSTAMEESIEAKNFIFRDMDNDGDQDFCAAVQNFVYVFENKNGLFQKAFTSSRYNYILQLAVADFNYDGRPDLLFSHFNHDYAGNGYQLMLQGNNFSFQPTTYSFTPEYTQLIGNFAVGDINNDGFADIMFGGSHVTNEKAKIFYNSGGNSFIPEVTELPSLGRFWLLDYNQDGNLDIVQSTPYGRTELQVYEGKGNLKFNNAREIEVINGRFNDISDIQTADIDLNGQPDLLFSGTGHLTILQSQGNGKYFPTVLEYPTYWEDRLLITDIDNDGDLDLYHEGLYAYYENRLRSVKNKSLPNLPVPTNITVKPGNTTKVSWSPISNSSLTQGITYNLLIKNATGKVIIHSETDASGKFRRWLGPGNAGSQSSYVINNLPADSYSVQVQSINAAFQTSSLSAPRVFQILEGPKSLKIERILLNKVRLTWQEAISGETKIIVERRTTNSDFTIIAQLPPNTTTYTDDKLSFNTVYTYRVSALMKNQYTAGSNQVNWSTGLFKLKQKPGLPSMVSPQVEVADFNNDGRLDLSLYGNPTLESRKIGRTQIVENTKTGWVNRPFKSKNDNYTQELQFFDFNNDQQLDLFWLGSGIDYQKISELHINKGNNLFQPEPSVFTSKSQSIINWWDMDSDNDLDALTFEVGSAYPWPKRIFQNNGNGNFKLKETPLYPCEGCSSNFTTNDYDRDGDEDLLQFAFTSEGGSGYYFIKNTDGKLTQTKMVIPSGDGSPIRLVDYNNDGWTDVFVLNRFNFSYNSSSELYRNQGVDANGFPVFTLVKNDFPSVIEKECEFADLDNDGDQDFFIGTTPFRIYINEGNDSFSEYVPPSAYYDQNQGSLFDYDQDGDLDIYLRGPYGSTKGRAVVLVNQVIVGPNSLRNQAPQPPTNLKAMQDEEGLHLSWNAATDDLTPSDGLTYDVVLYRNGKAITKAFLDPYTGNRQKLAAGRSLSKVTLKNLPTGAYTWKVQAVDASYQGSAFSAVGDFFFKPEVPEINDTLIYRCGQAITLKAKGEKIEWFKDSKLTIKLASGTFHPRASQIVYVTQTKNNLQSMANKVTITILERPEKPVLAANNRYTYCNPYIGMTLFLQASGENLKWYADNKLQQLISTGTWLSVPAAEKKYYITQTIQNCESLPVEITVGPTPFEAQITQKQDTLFAAEKNGLYYYWYLNQQPLFSGNKSFLKTNLPGTYKVYIYKDECFFETNEFVLTSSHASILKNVQVYPNPTTSDLFVKLPKEANSVELRVTDALGSQVYQTYQQNSTAIIHLPTKHWKKGFYFLHVISGQEKSVVKVILK